VADRERLFRLEAGGSSEHPITVPTASVVEARAMSFVCPRCQGALLPREHLAHIIDQTRLREVKASCASCAAGLSLWFKIAAELLN
jgi:hypothetical protein